MDGEWVPEGGRECEVVRGLDIEIDEFLSFKGLNLYRLSELQRRHEI